MAIANINNLITANNVTSRNSFKAASIQRKRKIAKLDKAAVSHSPEPRQTNNRH